jgi:5'-methylthioadenosine phosphorylase
VSGARAEIGVFGGSGLYRLLDDVTRHAIATPYGEPSDEIAIGKVGDREVAFMPRHGGNHTLPPAAINYRANLWAMHEIGVTRVIAPTAVGSLQPNIKPGDLVVTDQFVDRTHGREDTYFDKGPKVVHISPAHPYCPVLREIAIAASRGDEVTVHEQGTVVVVQGPRFSTRAESKWFTSMGWDIVNMTQYPEVVLARELEMCYLNISLVTDYDSGLEGHPNVKPVSVEEVERFFAANIQRLRELILRITPAIPAERTCPCATAMRGAVINSP